MRALLDNGMLDIKKIIKIILLPRPWSFNLRSCYLNSLRILPKLQRIGDAYSQHTLQWPRFTGCASPILHCQISCHHLRFRNEHLKGHGQGRIRRATLIQSYLLTRPPIPQRAGHPQPQTSHAGIFKRNANSNNATICGTCAQDGAELHRRGCRSTPGGGSTAAPLHSRRRRQSRRGEERCGCHGDRRVVQQQIQFRAHKTFDFGATTPPECDRNAAAGPGGESWAGRGEQIRIGLPSPWSSPFTVLGIERPCTTARDVAAG